MIGAFNSAALAADPSMTWSGGHAATLGPSAAVSRLLVATAKSQAGTIGPSGSSVPVYAATSGSVGPSSSPSMAMIAAGVVGLAAVAAVVYKMKKKKGRK